MVFPRSCLSSTAILDRFDDLGETLTTAICHPSFSAQPSPKSPSDRRQVPVGLASKAQRLVLETLRAIEDEPSGFRGKSCRPVKRATRPRSVRKALMDA